MISRSGRDLLVSASVNAMSMSGQAGKEYTNIGVGFGAESTGLALSGNWTHNDDDMAGIRGRGAGVESASRAVNGDRWRKRRLQPNYRDEGYAAAVGGGLQWKIGNSFPFVWRTLPGFTLQRY